MTRNIKKIRIYLIKLKLQKVAKNRYHKGKQNKAMISAWASPKRLLQQKRQISRTNQISPQFMVRKVSRLIKETQETTKWLKRIFSMKISRFNNLMKQNNIDKNNKVRNNILQKIKSL